MTLTEYIQELQVLLTANPDLANFQVAEEFKDKGEDTYFDYASCILLMKPDPSNKLNLTEINPYAGNFNRAAWLRISLKEVSENEFLQSFDRYFIPLNIDNADEA